MTKICREIFNQACVLANGDVVCSCIDVEGLVVLGNVKKDPIGRIFNGKQYERLRSTLFDSGDDSYCPSLNCQCPFKNVPADSVSQSPPHVIEKLFLETTSLCNLRCPACKASEWNSGINHPRAGTLPLETVREILSDTGGSLKELWLYNYGEPFQDSNLIEILRLSRRLAPQAWICIHTNGMILPPGWGESIIAESLVDTLTFSIDGASQETYARYRIGGDFHKAFGNMTRLAHIKKSMGKTKPDIIWQYILFQWNDSDSELLMADKLSRQYGIPIHWKPTHTPGRSMLFTPEIGDIGSKIRHKVMKDEKASLVCREIYHEPCVLASGDVVCSCMDVNGKRKLGNVNEKPLSEIITGKSYAKLRKMVLESGRSSWCPWLEIHCPFKNIPADDLSPSDNACAVEKIRLETISYCNLRCPECNIIKWYPPQYKDENHPRLAKMHPNTVRNLFEDSADSLTNIWFYNYGEPFLDKDFLEILRMARSIVPRAYLYVHTNGTVIPPGWPETIVTEGLLDQISFSIDGATPGTYLRYRVRGDFDAAMNNMKAFLESKIKHGRDIPKIIWQYILFEWNDSDQELELAQKTAEQMGITIQWILTHTKGRSRRFTEESEAYQKLCGIHHYSSEILAKQIDGHYREFEP